MKEIDATHTKEIKLVDKSATNSSLYIKNPHLGT